MPDHGNAAQTKVDVDGRAIRQGSNVHLARWNKVAAATRLRNFGLAPAIGADACAKP